MTAPSQQAIDALMSNAGRATLPFQETEQDRNYGTAFWYNHLIGRTDEREVFTPYLITAEALTGFDVATFTLRPDLGDPVPTAEQLIMKDYGTAWTRLPRLGIAVMPAARLHAYAERKGWRWSTDEITDGLAACENDVATIGRTPVAAYVLGHDVGEVRQSREQAVVVGAVVMDGRGRLRWDTRMPQGCVGAPVFTSIPLGDQRFKLVCLGVVLPGAGHNEIASFDRIRKEVAALSAGPSRRWWKRRKDE